MAKCRKCGTPNLTGVQYYAHHCDRCPICNDPIQHDDMEAHNLMHASEKQPLQSTAVIALPGDRVVVCFTRDDYTEEDSQNFIEKFAAKLPGMKVDAVFGVSGVFVYRGGESNDTDRGTDDSG